MEYLVLHQFTSYGRLLKKGDVVSEILIRSPRLRQSEGKIIPAVPSFEVPEEISTEHEAPQDISEGADNNPPESNSEKDEKKEQKPGGKFSLFLKKE